jgi:acetolactate synthase-1/2/3 large subunit
MQGDAGRVLHQIADAWDTSPKKEWLAQALDMADASVQSWDAQSDSPADGIHPGWLAREVNAFAHSISDSPTLVVDGGDILTWGIAYFRTERPGRIMTTGTALGTLGLGFPFAVAAKAARPDEPVFLLCGDGTFGFSAMELDTAARHGLPIVCVVSNNGAWVDVQYEQKQWFGEDRKIASDLGFRRYEKLAEMVGGYGAWVESPDDLRPALRAAIDANVPAVINVKTDPNVLSEILKGIGQLGVM